MQMSIIMSETYTKRSVQMDAQPSVLLLKLLSSS